MQYLSFIQDLIIKGAIDVINLRWIQIPHYIHQSRQIVGNKAKGKSQNGCFKKTKHAKFSEKRTFLIPWYAHDEVFFKTYNITSYLEKLHDKVLFITFTIEEIFLGVRE